jgi:predicted MFS family arabinose efflux permease
MSKLRSKLFCFIFEGLGSIACGFYGNYVFFMLRDRHGFGNLGNLSVSALQGLVIAIGSWQGGRFAQAHGCLKAIRIGLIGMAISLSVGIMIPHLIIQLVVLMTWTASMCFVWPALEAIISEGENNVSLLKILGVYNVVWGTCSALSYFFGGAVFEHLGLKSIYWLPTIIFILQFCLVREFVGRQRSNASISKPEEPEILGPETELFHPPTNARTFLHMAWFANPFACIGINTLLAMAPGLARNHHLSTTATGLFCSIWFFGRLASFIVLWWWGGWHYRFSGLLFAFVGLISGFATLLIADNLCLLVLAQAIFGFSVGLIYQSSLFYSMNVGDTKGEHGGLHEAAMGVGNSVGPAVGAISLWLAPHIPHVSVYAVSVLLGIGLLGLLRLRFAETG